MPVLPALTRVLTPDLALTQVAMEDLPETHRLHADPAVWRHFPSGRHTSLAQTRTMLEQFVGDWDAGVGYWTARTRDTGDYAGIGGCRLRAGVAWNIYYRVDPVYQGRGLATQIARAGMDAAATVDPTLPVSAFLLEHNLASRAVAEKLGLRLAWRGVEAGNPDPEAVRLIYTDRDLTEEQLAALRG